MQSVLDVFSTDDTLQKQIKWTDKEIAGFSNYVNHNFAHYNFDYTYVIIELTSPGIMYQE